MGSKFEFLPKWKENEISSQIQVSFRWSYGEGDSTEAESRRFKDAVTTDTKDSREINRKTKKSKDA